MTKYFIPSAYFCLYVCRVCVVWVCVCTWVYTPAVARDDHQHHAYVLHLTLEIGLLIESGAQLASSKAPAVVLSPSFTALFYKYMHIWPRPAFLWMVEIETVCMPVKQANKHSL